MEVSIPMLATLLVAVILARVLGAIVAACVIYTAFSEKGATKSAVRFQGMWQVLTFFGCFVLTDPVVVSYAYKTLLYGTPGQVFGGMFGYTILLLLQLFFYAAVYANALQRLNTYERLGQFATRIFGWTKWVAHYLTP